MALPNNYWLFNCKSSVLLSNVDIWELSSINIPKKVLGICLKGLMDMKHLPTLVHRLREG